jgi:WD40 repeat protein
MPLKKYNTLSVLIENTIPTTTTMNNNSNSNLDYSNKSSSSPSSNSSTNSPNSSAKNQPQLSQSPTSIANQMSLLNELLPNIIESAAGVSASSVSGSATATLINQNESLFNYSTYCTLNNINSSNQLPVELKTKLYNIFNQIEKEFDNLYTQNLKLQQQLLHHNTSTITNTSSTSTLVPNTTNTTNSNTNLNNNNNKKSNDVNSVISSTSSNDSSPKSTVVNSNVSSNSSNNLIRPPMNINLQPSSSQSLTSTAKSALLSSKSRINNLSFPKFKPNAKEFIMQSIKNTSAQIVQKTQNHNLFNSKLQCSLAGHKDGIWDINCIPIPSNLLINSTNSNMYNNLNHNNYNLLIGTASADTTARLWYFNSHTNPGQTPLPISSPQSSLTSFNNSQTTSTSFCIQEYCGHTGSVNSIRFHPRFFTHSTNLILTASGDCQAHIWQCVLSPDSDSLESTSQVVLNYSSCYSFAMSNNQNQSSPNNNNNNYVNDLVSNTAMIRSPIKRYEGHSDACIAAEWFPDGELLATASWDRMANVYNVETGKILCNLQHDDYLTNVSIHRQNKIILTSSKDTTFKVWDFRDPICTVNVYQGHNRSVNSAIFVNDDKIATASDDQTVKLWDLRIMRSPVCTINVNSGVNRICSINLNNNESNETTYLALPLDNRDIKIYNLNGERVLRMARNDRVGHRRLVTSLASYSNLLFSSSFDKMINCWSIYTNPSTSSKSSSSTNNNNKAQLNNKENDHNNSQLNEKSLDSSSSWHSSLFRSTSPQPSSNNYAVTTSVTSPLLINSNSSCSNNNHNNSQQPLNSISQNNSKGISSLSKLAERIKI